MSRAWGGSWGGAWGSSWGSDAAGGPSQLGGQGGSYGQSPFLWAPLGPPIAPLIIFTDRDDGTEWFLSHSVDGEHVALVSGAPYPRYGRILAFGPRDGPYLYKAPDIYLRLFVRGGNLGYEISEERIHSPPVNTRRGMSRDYHLLYIPPTWVEGDGLAFVAA